MLDIYQIVAQRVDEELETILFHRERRMPLQIDKATIDHLTRRQWAKLWGQKHMIKPVLIEKVFGAGDFLMGLTPLNTRPNYYLIRIDAKWWSDTQTDEFYDRLEDIYTTIEEECGTREFEDDDGKEHLAEWPALNLNAGCSWWDANDLLKERKANVRR